MKIRILRCAPPRRGVVPGSGTRNAPGTFRAFG
nr:MAG TPA: hypothetical protein [Caudoviricetes sp.]